MEKPQRKEHWKDCPIHQDYNVGHRKRISGGEMSRPRFLDCVMTPEIIRAIRNAQAEYDKDPAGYERRERERKEREEEERLAEEEFYRRQAEERLAEEEFYRRQAEERDL